MQKIWPCGCLGSQLTKAKLFGLSLRFLLAHDYESLLLALVMVTSASSLAPRTLHLYVPNSSSEMRGKVRMPEVSWRMVEVSTCVHM